MFCNLLYLRSETHREKHYNSYVHKYKIHLFIFVVGLLKISNLLNLIYDENLIYNVVFFE